MINAENSATHAPASIRKHALAVVLISALLLVPCFWHRHIEAGDLPSHVYNAWLAQLSSKGQAPGLYLAARYNNILFDLALFHTAKLLGLAAAEKVIVAIAVLIFFWGVFSFVHALAGRRPWLLVPAIAMLAYGYAFNMGFFNYYLSIGLACCALARLTKGGAGNWLIAALIAPITLLAHPIGFLWLLATLAYRLIRQNLRGWWKLALPASSAAALIAIHWYFLYRAPFPLDWDAPPIYLRTGADQLDLYGDRYATLSWIAFAFAALCVAADLFTSRRNHSARENPGSARKARTAWKRLIPFFELYILSFFATALLPENLHPNSAAGWIGLIVSRLTVITAIFGLVLLAALNPRKWHLAGFVAIAAVFFAFLYQDTAQLNCLESNAESILATLPAGSRIIPTVFAPPDWRITFIGHIADRACIHRCFTYSNYEPASQQFRVRISPQGSPLVTSSEDDAEDMSGGSYEIQDTDPPLIHLYQCDPSNLTNLCQRPLHESDTTAPPRAH